MQEREERQQDFDLCYHLKAWGVCRYVCRSYYSPTSSMHFILCSYIPYSGKLSQIGEKYDFHRENFRGLLTFAALKVPHPQILRRKLSRIATKLRNSRKFSPSKVSHCTVLSCLGSLVGLLGSYICNVWSRIRKWRKDWSHSSCE